jgi:hypothetical protein
MKNKFSIAMSLAVILAMLLTSLALADQINPDADTLVANNQATKDLGTVAPNAIINTPVSFVLECNGNKHVDNGQTVHLAFTLAGSTVPAGGSLSATNASIGPIPAGWPDDGNNCPTPAPTPITDNGDSTAMITAPSTPGTYSYVVAFSRDIGSPDITGGNTTVTFTLTVAGPSDTTAPVINYTLTPASPDGSNGWYKSNVSLVWSVTDPESSVSKTGCVDQNITADQGATTYTCSASSAGGSAGPVSVTIKRDATAPGIAFVSPSTSPWYNADVTANWSCSDSLSGAVSASASATTSGEGSSVPATGICTDNAGNTASNTQSFKIDKTGPSITASATKADLSAYTADTWTNQDVTVHFTCSDDGAGIASCPADVTYNSEGTFTALGTATDNAGNSANTSFGPVKIDKTAPTISGAPDRAPNGNNWYNADVTVSFTCADALSGVASCSDPSTLGEGANQSVLGAVTDLAGNTASATVSGINIDETVPSITAQRDTPANSFGWNNTDVASSYSASDALSGLATPATGSFNFTAEGAGQSHTFTVTDLAGNSANASVTGINIDKTNPTIAFVGPSTSAWYTADVTASWSCSDVLSGAVSASVNGTASGEGNAVPATGSCADKAGNTASDTQSFKIDKTAPTITWNGGPAAGVNYDFGFVPAAPTCTAVDTLSGPNGCTVIGYGTTVGSHTMTATAYDVAGNMYSETRTYSVDAWILKGFYQPVDMNGIYNTVKNGSTVPFKFEIFTKNSGAEITDTTGITFTYAQTSCDANAITDDIETTATGGTSLRYDAAAGQFVYNWKTPATAGKCYRVTMSAPGGTSLVAYFKLK